MSPEFFAGKGRKVGRGHVEYGEASFLPFFGKTIEGSCISKDHMGGKFRIGVQLQTIFHHMVMFFMDTGPAAAEYKLSLIHI